MVTQLSEELDGYRDCPIPLQQSPPQDVLETHFSLYYYRGAGSRYGMF